MSYLARWNNFFFSKSLSLFDWFGISVIGSLAKHDSVWWLLLIIVWIPVSVHLTNRFTIEK